MSDRRPRLASDPPARVASPYLTASEAAAYLKYASVDALYQAVRALGIPVRHRGRTLLFVPAELDRWLAGESRVALMSEARKRG